MSMLGKNIRLKGITAKGKNRVKQHGEFWTVLAETDKILFSSEKGPWLFISPAGKGQDDKAARWVRADGDTDFNWELVK